MAQRIDRLVEGCGSVYLLRPLNASKLRAHLASVRIERDHAKGGN